MFRPCSLTYAFGEQWSHILVDVLEMMGDGRTLSFEFCNTHFPNTFMAVMQFFAEFIGIYIKVNDVLEYSYSMASKVPWGFKKCYQMHNNYSRLCSRKLCNWTSKTVCLNRWQATYWFHFDNLLWIGILAGLFILWFRSIQLKTKAIYQDVSKYVFSNSNTSTKMLCKC